MKFHSDDIRKYQSKLDNFLTEDNKNKSISTDTIISNLPTLNISEDWGTYNTEDRAELEIIIGDYCKGSDPISRIISFVNTINTNTKNTVNASVSEIFKTIVSLKTISKILSGFSYSGAGFLWEAFSAAIVQGTQIKLTSETVLQEGYINESGSEDIPIVDVVAGGKVYSIKLLTFSKHENIDSQRLGIKGSIKNLTSAVKKYGSVTYIIIGRRRDGKSLEFYKVVVDGKNINQFLDGQYTPGNEQHSSVSVIIKNLISNRQDTVALEQLRDLNRNDTTFQKLITNFENEKNKVSLDAIKTYISRFIDKKKYPITEGDTQFKINLGTKNFNPTKFETLNIDKDILKKYVDFNKKTIEEKIIPVYKDLGEFTSDLTMFLTYDKKNTKEVKKLADDTTKSVDKLEGSVVKLIKISG